MRKICKRCTNSIFCTFHNITDRCRIKKKGGNMKWIDNSNRETFYCDYHGCHKTTTHRWDFNNHHFCCEEHLRAWVREKTLAEPDGPYGPHRGCD